MDGEDRLLSGDFRVGVVLGEGHLHVPVIARLRAGQLVFEARNEAAATDLELHPLTAASLE